ncbi:aspartate aminotransferase family protein [Crossiella sp. NPDC003009]
MATNLVGDVRELYSYSVGTVTIVDGEGVYACDAEGNKYLDCAAGTFNLSIGYRHPALVKAIQQQAELLVHASSSFQNHPVNDLVRRLVAVSPENIQRVHLKVASGSDANEGAIKLAQRATGRRDIISLFRGHHGQTMATTAISGNAFRRAPFPEVGISRLIVPDPYCHRCFYGQRRETCGLMCVNRIDDFIEFASSGSVAAVIVEPITGNGGNVVAPEGYLARLREFCDERDIVLIFDEIQTGIGRTGRMFAAEHFGVQPDVITIGKGLGGGAQVAAMLSDPKLGPLETEYLSFTSGANVLAAAAANAVLSVVDDEAFLANVRAVGAHILRRLTELRNRHRCVDDIRGVGLMIGFEVVDQDGTPSPALTNEIVRKGREHGLLLRSSRYGLGNVVKIRPPLILTHEEADLICDRLDRVLTSL